MIKNGYYSTILISASKIEVLAVQKKLRELGALTQIEELAPRDDYPFPLGIQHVKAVNKELKKAARSKSNLAVLLTMPIPTAPDAPFPSILGDVTEDFEEYLRESDTIIGLDERRLMVLGFCTDKIGTATLQKKVGEKLSEVFGASSIITNGYAIFPDEGQNLKELLKLAESRRLEEEKSSYPDASPSPANQSCQGYFSGKSDLELGYLSLVYKMSRGRNFRKLTSLDPEVIWGGLRRLNSGEQQQFINRLEYDSPLVIYLLKRIPDCREAHPKIDPLVSISDAINPVVFQKELKIRQKNRELVLARLEETSSLPTIPEIAMQVFELASDPELMVEEVSELIGRDPALSSKVLQVVNSPYFGFNNKIDNVGRAVVLLGLEEVVNISLGLATANVFKTSSLSDIYKPEMIWHRSIHGALITKKLCQGLSQDGASTLYSIALMRDIGMIFLADHFLSRYKDIHENAVRFDIPIHDLEEEVFGIDHALISEKIARRWNFPENLANGLGYHHKAHENKNNPNISALIGLTDHLYCQAFNRIDNEDRPHGYASHIKHGHWQILIRTWPKLKNVPMKKLIDQAINTITENDEISSMYF